MSIDVPLMYNSDTPISALGSEFAKIQQIDRDRGLIDPYQRSNYSNGNTTDRINLAGFDVSSILQNNQNPSEELYQTDAQARLFLNRNLSGRPLTETEKQVELYEDHDLDPRVRQELKEEARRYNSNMFSTESQDFVRTIQEDIKNYYDEENLYYQQVPFTQSREGLIRQFAGAEERQSQDDAEARLAQTLASGFIADALKKKEEEEKAKSERERILKEGRKRK
jgi:hypothetical protein